MKHRDDFPLSPIIISLCVIKNGRTDASADVEQDKTNFQEAEITAAEDGINEIGSISVELNLLSTAR